MGGCAGVCVGAWLCSGGGAARLPGPPRHQHMLAHVRHLSAAACPDGRRRHGWRSCCHPAMASASADVAQLRGEPLLLCARF